MNGTDIAAIVVGVGGVITAIGVQVRGVMGDRFKRRVDQAAALLSGYTEMVTNLRTELKECQASNAVALDAARDHARRNREQAQLLFERERNEWRKDKAELKQEIADQREEIETLQAQVVALMSRMDGREYPDRDRPDPPPKGVR